MWKKIVGIFVYMLLIVNVSTVFGISEEKENTNDERQYCIFDNSSGKKEIKYNEIVTDIKSSITKKTNNNLDDNLIPNPSFEEGDTLPIGWTYETNTNGIFNWDPNYAHSGEKSVGVSNIATITSDSWGLCWESDFISVDFIDYAYTLSGWIKIIGEPSSSCQTAFVGYLSYDVNYQHLAGYGQGNSGNFSEWGFFDIMVPRDIDDFEGWSKVKYVKIYLGQIYYIGCNEQPDPSVEIRFDDIYLGVFTQRPTSPTCSLDKKNKEIVVSSTDGDGDQIRYGVIWNGTNSLYNWTDYYNSGKEARIDCKGRNGIVRIFAEDIHGASIMKKFSIKSKEKSIKYPILNWFLEKFLQRYPFLSLKKC